MNHTGPESPLEGSHPRAQAKHLCGTGLPGKGTRCLLSHSTSGLFWQHYLARPDPIPLSILNPYLAPQLTTTSPGPGLAICSLSWEHLLAFRPGKLAASRGSDTYSASDSLMPFAAPSPPPLCPGQALPGPVDTVPFAKERELRLPPGAEPKQASRPLAAQEPDPPERRGGEGSEHPSGPGGGAGGPNGPEGSLLLSVRAGLSYSWTRDALEGKGGVTSRP